MQMYKIIIIIHTAQNPLKKQHCQKKIMLDIYTDVCWVTC